MELAEGGDLAQRMEELHHYGVRTPCFARMQKQSCIYEASAFSVSADGHAVDICGAMSVVSLDERG
jgi:hypothetical protein